MRIAIDRNEIGQTVVTFGNASESGFLLPIQAKNLFNALLEKINGTQFQSQTNFKQVVNVDMVVGRQLSADLFTFIKNQEIKYCPQGEGNENKHFFFRYYCYVFNALLSLGYKTERNRVITPNFFCEWLNINRGSFIKYYDDVCSELETFDELPLAYQEIETAIFQLNYRREDF